jgi:site-specific recombinase XerD
MPIYPRGNSFQAVINHRGQRYRVTKPTRAEAVAWELRNKALIAEGKPVETEGGDQSNDHAPSTLEQLYSLVHSRYWKGAKAERPQTFNANKVLDALGRHLPPAAVDEHKIDAMVLSFAAEGISDSTINRRLSTLSKMMTFAHERGYIVRKPKIERKKEPEHRIRYLSYDEEQNLLAYFPHIGQPDMRDIVILGVDTGVRMGEMLSIQPRDVELTEDSGVLTLWNTKSGKPRSIPLTKRASEVIRRRSEGLRPTDKLFAEWTYQRVRHYWDTARQHMGMMTDPQFVAHCMRHTFCSRLVQRGVDIVSVSKLAGHSSIVVTMRYAHLAPNNLVQAVKALES